MGSIDRHTLHELRDAMVAQARQWLTSDDACQAWCVFNRDAFGTLLATPLGELVDLPASSAALAAVQAEGLASETIVPALQFALRESMARMSQRGESLGELVGEQGREAVVALAARPDVVDETLLRALAEDDAMVAAMKDVLYEALVQFSDRVNPFVADWGLPRLLDQLPLFGKGTLRKAFASTRAEFDKRLEPEIKKFLKGFARKGTMQLVALLLDKRGEPELQAMRQHLAELMLDQRLSEMTWSPDEERGAQLSDTIVAALVGALRHPVTRQLLEQAWEELLDRWSPQPLGEVLDELGIARPEVVPFAAASWPAVRAALTSAGALDGLARAIDGAHEAWLAGR
ncbi:MAG: hypothetical protein JRI68_08090 [Deltaproteobacteria bacterium]|nr:hypothetical protein [Deltaproteobacteria bacterium]